MSIILKKVLDKSKKACLKIIIFLNMLAISSKIFLVVFVASVIMIRALYPRLLHGI